MLEFDWFEEDPEFALSEAQRAFLAALRDRARSWPCTPNYTQLVEPDAACNDWRAILDVCSEIADHLTLVTVGVGFDDASIRAGEVHSQNYHFLSQRDSRVEPLAAVGTPEHLASVAADWFEHIMARPVVLREWEREGRSWSQYVFADTGTGISRRGLLGDFNSAPDRVIHARGMPLT